MLSSKNKLLLAIYVIFVISLLGSVITFSILGNKERIGFLEVVGKDESKGTHKIRVRYYDKVFRSSDIYGVYVKEESIPADFNNVIWDGKDSPFGDVIIANDLEVGYKISDIVYTLKVKKMLIFYLIFIIMALPIVYTAFSKSNMKIFYTTDEVLKSINNQLPLKNIYYILGIVGILLVFGLLWYNNGYYSYFSMIDSVIESNGTVINFKFPENLFEKTTHTSATSYWYKSRWSGTAFIFLSSNIISPIYTFITGDVVKSIFASQGVMVSFIFTATGFMLALYIAQVFAVKIISKYFLLFLFISQAMQIVVYSIAGTNKNIDFFIGLMNSGSPMANYNGSLLVLLLALFPYWRYFITGKWDDWFDKKGLIAVYHLVIILAAFSSPAITAFYGLVSGFIFISILVKEKAIPAINHKIASTLYASMFWTTVAIVSESKYVITMVGAEFSSKIQGLQTSMLVILIYTAVFIVLAIIPTIAIYKSQKKQSISIEHVKKILFSMLLCYIGMFTHLGLASLKNKQTLLQLINTGYGAAFNSAYICVANIFLVLAVMISFTSLFVYLKLSFVKGFAIMFLVSHCIFYIGYNINNNVHADANSFFTTLYKANKEKDVNSNIVYLDKEMYNKYLLQWASSDFHIKITENFARRFNLIDKNAVIMEKPDEQ